MNVVIFGCGRTGSVLALQLAARGHKVWVIEQNPDALKRLGKNHNCEIIIGSGIDEDVLLAANIENADAFFAVTRGDNSNLMAAQIVRMKYKVPYVCVKVADPHRAEAYRKLGYECVTASSLVAGYMRDWLMKEPFKTLDTYNELPPELEF
ncbi:MAG: Trk system potassium uptake protein TrkA [Fimbriimonadaceae bacterium]|nr:Trk system potassium uptake protein TrkA [Fimbriimonadaceae bacterium]